MRFYLDYPLSVDDSTWLDPARIKEFAQVAESAGVDCLGLTDHPAPSRKWRDAGGHDTLDPFAGLCFFAAVTSRIRLMTHLTVAAYRNPFLLAKAMTTVDVLSGGRATFTVGTGYLRSEFAALGVDYAERNGIFDETMEVVRGQLSSPHEFHHEGERFKGFGVTMSPPPVQSPHPPLWLGGNAAITRRRVADWGDGWAPLTSGGAMLSKTARTAPIMSNEQLGAHIIEIKDAMAANGRDPDALDVAAGGVDPPGPGASADEKLEHIAAVAELGVNWTMVPMDPSSFGAAVDSISAFGRDVIGAL